MKRFIAVLGFVLASYHIEAQIEFDYSIFFVPEERGIKFEKITEDADCVADYCGNRSHHGRKGNIVSSTSGSFNSRNATSINWWVLPQIALSPDGKRIGYINEKNGTTNIMIKSAVKGGASVQRTFRTSVQGFTWSRDGKDLCFTEMRGGHQGVYLVSADQGTVVRSISSSSDDDYGGTISPDGNTIFFHRSDGYSSYSLWSYDRKTNLFSNYSHGMTACPIPDNNQAIYCARITDKGESEIWRINFATGVEELILGQSGKSYTSPQLSPDGQWLLVTGSSLFESEGVDNSMTRWWDSTRLGKVRSAHKNIVNTDIFAVRTDGTQLTQLTYHPGNDLSPVWSPDGRNIYFLSQRGSADRIYNVWRMDFNL